MWCDVEKDVSQAIDIFLVITLSLFQYEPHGIHVLLRSHVDVLMLCDDRWLRWWYLIAHIVCWCVHCSLIETTKDKSHVKGVTVMSNVK